MQASGARLVRRINRPDRCKHLTARTEPFEETLASTGGVHRCSACALRADRRDKLLKWFDTAGSKLHAEQQPAVLLPSEDRTIYRFGAGSWRFRISEIDQWTADGPGGPGEHVECTR